MNNLNRKDKTTRRQLQNKEVHNILKGFPERINLKTKHDSLLDILHL